MVFRTSRSSKAWLRLASHCYPRLFRFYCSPVNKPQGTRSLYVDFASLGSGCFCQHLFCDSTVTVKRALMENSINFHWSPNVNVTRNMEEAKELSVHGGPVNTENDESTTVDRPYGGELTLMSINVTGVNQEQSSTNQTIFPEASSVQEQVPLNSKNEINYDKREELESHQYSVKSPNLNSLNDVDSVLKELSDNDYDSGKLGDLENVSNQEEDILSCDDDLLGLDTLFDEGLQSEGTSRGVNEGKKRPEDCVSENDCDDYDSLGLKELFDEDSQHRSTVKWLASSKNNAKLRKRERRKRKRQLSGLSDGDDLDVATASTNKDDSSSSKPRKKPKRIAPNYFIAIRVSNPNIHSGVKIVQDSVVSHNETLKPSLIPLATLHLTLLVVHLEDEKQIQKATEILQHCRTSLEPIFLNSALTLNFTGLDHFRNQVLFVKLCGEEGIAKLSTAANIVRDAFTSEGIPSTDSREFNPHLTVMKLTRSPKLRKKGIRKIPVESYATWTDLNFGEERVCSLHLCSMNKKQKDGFYKCVTTITFEADGEVSDELHTMAANVAKGDDIALMDALDDNASNVEPFLATSDDVVTDDSIKDSNELSWSSANIEEMADSVKPPANDDGDSSEPYLETINVVIEGSVKEIESENVGNAKDSNEHTSTNTDCVDAETVGENTSHYSNSCVSGQILEECDS